MSDHTSWRGDGWQAPSIGAIGNRRILEQTPFFGERVLRGSVWRQYCLFLTTRAA